MRALVLLGIAVLWGANAVYANPWPREDGDVFVALSGTYRYASRSNSDEFDGSAYLEYGLTDKVTLGLSANDNRIDYTHAYGFLRRSLSRPSRQLKIAASIGLGASRRDNTWGHMVRLGLSVGRPTRIWKPGWWSVTTAIEEHALWPDPIYKLDATFGLKLTPRLQTILDLEASQRSGSADTITLRTSVAWAVREGSHLVIGLEAKEINETFLGLRIGWWRTF